MSVSLLSALEASQDCPVCQLMADACEGLLWMLLWESVNDPGVRARIRRALGFCPRHTLRLCQVAQAEGLGMTGPAIIFADVLATLWTRLQTSRSPVSSEGPCPVCAHEQAVAGDGVFAVLQYVKHPSLGALIRERGLCRPHYRMAGSATLRSPRARSVRRCGRRLFGARERVRRPPCRMPCLISML